MAIELGFELEMGEVSSIRDQVDAKETGSSRLLFSLVYKELRALAASHLAREPGGLTIQPAELVHEAFIRLVQNRAQVCWDSKGHFFASAAEAMRRILIDSARKKNSEKRGGNFNRVSLSHFEPADEAIDNVDVIALDQALTKLKSISPRKAKLVNLRFFGALTQQEAALSLGICTSTADTDWAYAKAWLKDELADEQVAR